MFYEEMVTEIDDDGKMRVPIQDVALRFKVRLKEVTVLSQITSHRLVLVFSPGI